MTNVNYISEKYCRFPCFRYRVIYAPNSKRFWLRLDTGEVI